MSAEGELKNAFHVYPTSLDLEDLAWEQDQELEAGTTLERRRDLQQAGCALCQAGQCVQVVQRNACWSDPVVTHSLGLN